MSNPSDVTDENAGESNSRKESFRSPDGSMVHCKFVDAFVDDTALGFTDAGDRTLPELVSALEKAAQTCWE